MAGLQGGEGVNYQYFLCGELRLMIIVRRVCQVCCRNLLQTAITKRYQRLEQQEQLHICQLQLQLQLLLLLLLPLQVITVLVTLWG